MHFGSMWNIFFNIFWRLSLIVCEKGYKSKVSSKRTSVSGLLIKVVNLLAFKWISWFISSKWCFQILFGSDLEMAQTSEHFGYMTFNKPLVCLVIWYKPVLLPIQCVKGDGWEGKTQYVFNNFISGSILLVVCKTQSWQWLSKNISRMQI